MSNDTGMAKFVRGLVKTVFILCYIAFMWASIHHVAAYFNNFEASQTDTLGSYLLAGAFDVTALVTTIGVMFFRKSMPVHIQWILWTFIVAIALYSYFINWEYAAHYQSADLILQPTGATTPVYDAKGVLHYVPEMRANTMLLWINPLTASGFTVFSLIYSIVAEFFGTKPPTADELLKRKQYLEETATIKEEIKKLEEKGKGKSLLSSLTETAKEGKAAWKELTKTDDADEESAQESERNTDELEVFTDEESAQESSKKTVDADEESAQESERKARGKREGAKQELTEESVVSWLSTGSSTISLQTVVKHTNLNIKRLRNRVESKQIRATKNKDIVYKDSLIKWMKDEGILTPSGEMQHLQDNPLKEEKQPRSQSEKTSIFNQFYTGISGQDSDEKPETTEEREAVAV